MSRSLDVRVHFFFAFLTEIKEITLHKKMLTLQYL